MTQDRLWYFILAPILTLLNITLALPIYTSESSSRWLFIGIIIITTIIEWFAPVLYNKWRNG